MSWIVIEQKSFPETLSRAGDFKDWLLPVQFHVDRTYWTNHPETQHILIVYWSSQQWGTVRCDILDVY